MSSHRTQEVLYETEAALRLVDHGLQGLRDDAGESDSAAPTVTLAGPGLSELPAILERANTQIMGVLARLRESRAAIESTAIEKLASTHEKIREVTSATEDAAINIMDACDRATQMVDELDTIDGEPEPDRARAGEVRASLRDELFLMMGALQFQDITSQQLAHASAVLVEMEARLIEVARLFDAQADLHVAPARLDKAPDEKTYDPNATTRDSESRQALADEIFTAVRAPAA
jgi:chemotaxis regulatin CheY-phosphate phosphatase CheZ